jgi:hypothetical protein
VASLPSESDGTSLPLLGRFKALLVAMLLAGLFVGVFWVAKIEDQVESGLATDLEAMMGSSMSQY